LFELAGKLQQRAASAAFTASADAAAAAATAALVAADSFVPFRSSDAFRAMKH
jgi:hypothetical protein